MIYMIDFNGVITRHPKKFLDMCKTLKYGGDTIYICTGRTREETREELKKLGFIYNEKDKYGEIRQVQAFNLIISLTEEVKENVPETEIEYDFNGNLWVDGTIWWKLKGQICKKFGVNVFIDDTEEYFPYISNNIVKMLVPPKF